MTLLQKLKGEMETDRLLLRRWQQSDLDAFVKIDSDPDVMVPSGARPSSTLEEATANFHRAMRDRDCYAIVLRKTGETIGKIKFQKDLRRHLVNSLSVAYELRKDQWGNGYMPEALQAMIACAFEKRKADVLAVSHFTVNNRSRRVIEKCGFRREGVIPWAFKRYDGEIFDDVCYSILREEYLSDRKKYLEGQDARRLLPEDEEGGQD